MERVKIGRLLGEVSLDSEKREIFSRIFPDIPLAMHGTDDTFPDIPYSGRSFVRA